jgi:hypothetical protein
MGVSSGASLGAVAAIVFGWRLVGIWGGALGGAGLVLLLVLGIAGIGRRMSSFTLLLAGIAINSMCSAVILFLHSIAGLTQSFSVARWMMGGIDSVDYSTLGWLALVILPTVAVVLARGTSWNLMAVGEDWAAARGVSVKRLLLTGYLAGALLTAPVTAVTGPIGSGSAPTIACCSLAPSSPARRFWPLATPSRASCSRRRTFRSASLRRCSADRSSSGSCGRAGDGRYEHRARRRRRAQRQKPPRPHSRPPIRTPTGLRRDSAGWGRRDAGPHRPPSGRTRPGIHDL